jgi:hypothetical protein
MDLIPKNITLTSLFGHIISAELEHTKGKRSPISLSPHKTTVIAITIDQQP